MDTSKIIKGVVNSGRYTVTAPIIKEDYGLYLQIEGVELPQTYEVDFSNSEHSGTSVTMIGNSDGVLIPHQFIDTGKDIFAFLYHVGANYGRTVYKFRIPNKVRPDRTDDTPTPEQASVIDQAISALNTAVEQTAQDVIDADASAQSASQSAENAHDSAVDAQNYAETAQTSANNASASASQASASATASAQSASQSAQIKADVEDLADDAQGYAQASAQSASASANLASQAQEFAQSASASAQSASGYASQAQTSAQTASSKATEASTSAQMASTKATEASQSASQASGYAQTAETAKTDAQTAKTQADTARDEAVTAKTAAETAQGKAEDAQAAAESVAESIPSDYSQLSEDVSDLKEGLTATETYIIGKGNLLNHTTWADGKIDTDGTIEESTVSEYTALIPVDDGIEYTYVCDITRTDIPTRILGYTDNGAFIGLVVSIAGGNTGRRINTFIPSDSVKNIRISRYGINPSVSLVKGKTIQGEINVIDGQIADIQNNIEISGIYKPVSGFSGITTYSGYVNDSGVIVDGGTGWVRSDYIPTAEGASIVASLKGYSTFPIVAFYDSAKVYMASESILANKQLVVDVNTYVPSGVAYAIFVSQTNYDGRGFTIGTPAKISEALDIVADDLYGFKGLKVLCLGDSLTAGRDGLGNILSRNYPYYMQQTMLKGCVVDNKGVVGTTSKTYWNNYIDDVTLDNTIDIVLMMWGTNGGLVSTNALATDVEPYDDYNDYADTGVGCYCKIIEYVMGQTQNHAQVILITPPYNGDTSINDRVILAQPVVKQIAERYNLPVINMFKCGIGKFNFSTFMPDDSVHFNEAGYRWIGTYIGSCVNAITAKRNI